MNTSTVLLRELTWLKHPCTRPYFVLPPSKLATLLRLVLHCVPLQVVRRERNCTPTLMALTMNTTRAETMTVKYRNEKSHVSVRQTAVNIGSMKNDTTERKTT